MASAGWRNDDRRCRRPSELAAVAAARSPARTSNSSSWPWPSSATTPSTSPGTGRTRRPGASCPALRPRAASRGGRVRGARAACGARARATAGISLDGLAEHQLDDPLLGARGDVDDADRLAVAQHGGAVADGGDLDQPVGDEDDGPVAASRCRPTTSSTRSVRSAGSAAVISSSIRTSGSIASARARSMTRSVASGRSPRHGSTGRGRPMPSSPSQWRNGSSGRLGQAQVGRGCPGPG